MVEEFNKDDSFHLQLQAQVFESGKVVSINWPPEPDHNGPWVGLIVLLAYGELITRRFAVTRRNNEYRLKVGGKTTVVKSDYFMG